MPMVTSVTANNAQAIFFSPGCWRESASRSTISPTAIDDRPIVSIHA